MNRVLKKRAWLAGASLLAIILGAGDASAVVFQGPGGGGYIIPSTGWYDFTVAGAQGGGRLVGFGGDGALVGGELFLDAGMTLSGAGGYLMGNGSGGGGGGGTFVYGATGLLFAAGGGSGQQFIGAGNPGIGSGARPGGGSGYGYAGAGGLGVPVAYPFTGPAIGGMYLPGVPATSGSNGGYGAQACSARRREGLYVSRPRETGGPAAAVAAAIMAVEEAAGTPVAQPARAATRM
jgi:hypothetical protein